VRSASRPFPSARIVEAEGTTVARCADAAETHRFVPKHQSRRRDSLAEEYLN